MKNTTLKSKITKGFSLVEMLVVIAVIGVIAAIAIPNIGGITGAATKAKDQRNAQSLASVYTNGVAAGAFTATTEDAAVTAAITGVTLTTGAFSGSTFRAAGISTTDAEDAKDYLDFSGGTLVYFPEGAPTGG